jgi:hypothetical protein
LIGLKYVKTDEIRIKASKIAIARVNRLMGLLSRLAILVSQDM